MSDQHNLQVRQPPALSIQWLICLVMIAVVTYGAGFQGVFIFDDREEIQGNKNIQSLWPIWQPMFVPKNLPVRPLPYLSFAINYAIHGYDVFGYHLVNLGIHVATAWVIFSIIWQVLSRKQWLSQSDEINKLFALATSVLWMIHPLQTQPVNYIYQRIEMMMSMFFMLSLYCFLWSVWHLQKKMQRLYFLLTFLTCGSGMLCKEVMLVAPMALIWFDRVVLAESWRELLSKRAKAHLVMFSTWFILFLVIYQQSGQYSEYKGVKKLATPLHYLYTESEVLCHYLQQIIFPNKLVFDYYWPIKTELGQVLLPGMVIVILLLINLILMINRPVVGFVAGWFFLLLGVTSSFNPVLQPACEHRLHLALLGPIMLMNLCLYSGISRIANSDITKIKSYFLMCFYIVGASYLIVSAYRSTVYTNYLAMWHDTAEKQPNHYLPYYQLGTAYLNERKYELAEKYCKEALRCDPRHCAALNNYGLALSNQGKTEESAKAYRKAIEIEPALANSYLNLGNYYYNKRTESIENVEQAISLFEQALKQNPQYDSALVNLGIAYAESKKDYKKAIMSWELALQINPDNATARNYREMLLLSLQKKH